MGTDVTHVFSQSLTSNRYADVGLDYVPRISLYKYIGNESVSETIPFSHEEGQNTIRFFIHRSLKYIWYSNEGDFSPLRCGG